MAISPAAVLIVVGPLIGMGAGILAGAALAWQPVTPEQNDYELVVKTMDDAMEAAGDWAHDGDGPVQAIRRLRRVAEGRNGASHRI